MALRIVLLSTYDQGHQPLGLASPAAFLKNRGHEVRSFDTSVEAPDPAALARADLVAFFLPMHTATRLAVPWIAKVRKLNPRARLAAYGLYAGLNRDYLRQLGVRWMAPVPMARSGYPVPSRDGLKPLERYSKLRVNGHSKRVGYTEASHGCKHLCRHCPVVPVYQGAFRVIDRETVLADIRQLVAAGAEHITFGDPDFLNGPLHAMRIVEDLSREFPGVTYDATIKIEHLRKHRDLLPRLRDTGCAFVTSAVESIDDNVLSKLRKGHTYAHFLEVVELFRRHGLTLAPTFLAFTPWTTRESYLALLKAIAELGLVENVASVQLGLRLLITAQSPLLELPEIQRVVTGFDAPSLLHRWRHPDPVVEDWSLKILRCVADQQKKGSSRTRIFERVWKEVAHEPLDLIPRSAIPYLDEPWYC